MLQPTTHRTPIGYNAEGQLVVPHLGITLRALMGKAISVHPDAKKTIFPVVCNGKLVGEVRLGKDFQ